jgi:hypothetical protein
MYKKLKIISVYCFIFITLILAAYSWSASTSSQDNNGWIHLSSKNGDIIAPSPSTQQTASLVLDVDRDGINDFIIGSRKQGASLLWYRRVADGWTKYLVEDKTLPIEAGGAFHDIDRDGDLDLVFGADSSDNQMWWWENPYPNYEPNTSWKRSEIKNTGANKHHDQIFGDFDGDGTAELIFWNQKADKLFLANVPSDPKNTQPWSYTAIYTSASESEGLAKADLDGDGKLDIIGGGRWFKHQEGNNYTPKEKLDKIGQPSLVLGLGLLIFRSWQAKRAWLLSINSVLFSISGSFCQGCPILYSFIGAPNIIDNEQSFSRAASGQLKQGGWSEVVFVVGDGIGRLKWYEWTGKSWVGHDLLGFDVNHGHSLEVVDINNDGNLDIFCAEMRLNGKNPNAKMWRGSF